MIRRLLVLSLVLGFAAAHAEVRTFPGCGATLQACLDAAPVGDTVRITADVPTAETLVARRSVTLEGASGRMPRLAFGTTLTVTPEGGAPASFTVRDLELRGGWIDVTHERAADLTVTITGIRFVHGGPRPIIRIGEPVKVPNDPYGALTTTIADNTLVADGADASNGIAVHADYASRMSVAVLRNTLEVGGIEQWGVWVDAGAVESEVDVIGNRVAGVDYATGVTVHHRDGVLRTRVVGNVVRGQDSDAFAALSVETHDGTADVLVVNNTVARNLLGLVVYAQGGTMAGEVANNLVVENAGTGLYVQSASTRNNLVFANGIDAFDPGPGTRLADPRFVGGTLRLAPDSPARDAGATDVVPGDVTTDADGNPRLAGPAVDIGAFEAPCPECPPDAPPVACDDGDPCTLDVVDGGACTHASLGGVAAVACTCGRAPLAACAGHDVPAGVRRKSERACTLIGPAATRKAVKQASRQWSGALRQARTRATRRRVGADCATAIAAGLGDAVARARGYLGTP